MKKIKLLLHHIYRQAKKIQPIAEEIMKIIFIKYQNIKIQYQNKTTLNIHIPIKKYRLKNLLKKKSETHKYKVLIMTIKKN